VNVNRLMREIGPTSDLAPAFPLASKPVLPLRSRAEAAGSAGFSPLWSGQAGGVRSRAAGGELTQRLASEALARMARLT
jgi:nitronate monooxygenase